MSFPVGWDKRQLSRAAATIWEGFHWWAGIAFARWSTLLVQTLRVREVVSKRYFCFRD